MIHKIAIIGPESTGKTVLAKQLAELYDTVYVPEYARQYLDIHGTQYSYEDVLKMAKGQIELEKQMLSEANEILFSDTDMLCYKVWLDFYKWEVPRWMNDHISSSSYGLYLLSDIDIPWVADPQRENPNDRELLFHMFQSELDAIDANYGIVAGAGALRIDNAISTIEEYLRL